MAQETLSLHRDASLAESYKEFATNTSVLNYDERNHELRVWETTAVYTFAWSMTYQREHGPQTEAGTDRLSLHVKKINGWSFFVTSFCSVRFHTLTNIYRD